MGSTFYNGLKKHFSEDDLYICDKNMGKLDELGAKNSSTNPDEILGEANVVILAIKPQALDEFISSTKINLNYKLLISIMAGVSFDQLSDITGSRRIVRAMPNLPVQVGQGVIGWCALAEVGDSDRVLIKKIFKSLGTEISVKHEEMLNGITILSGCGPAYFFLIAEQLADKARAFGFSEKDAQNIAEKTLLGSAELLKKGNKSAKEWRWAVASKGGVTEAVLDSLTDAGFGEMFDNALEAGLKRNDKLNT